MRRVVLELGLFDPIAPNNNIKWSEMVLMPLLEIAAWANAVVFRCNPSYPSLYELAAQGLVRYKTEDSIPGEEPFYGILEVIKRRGSDCNNLCPIRVAELRVRGTGPLIPNVHVPTQVVVADLKERLKLYKKGEPAAFRIIKFERPNKPLLYHIQVRRAPTSVIPNPLDPRLVEDPSALLGMPTGA